jgi:HEAT repeat protein
MGGSMKREHLYYAVIAGGLLIVTLVAVINYWPSGEEPLDPPAIVAERLTTSSSADEKVRAAHDFIRHGESARVEIRAALERHETLEPEVVAPQLQATGKTRDYRSMPTLLELLESPDPLVRGQAAVAIEKILGVEFGFDPHASPAERAKMVALIKQDYQNAGARLEEFYDQQTQ